MYVLTFSILFQREKYVEFLLWNKLAKSIEVLLLYHMQVGLESLVLPVLLDMIVAVDFR